MPSKPASTVADACARRAKYIIAYSARISARCNSDADKNQVYAGAYVAYLAFFEQQLEELFLGLLSSRYAHPNPAVRPLVATSNRTVAAGLVRGGRSYVDWLPYELHTKKRAPAFFKDGEPFSRLEKAERDVLERASILRNALAHQSDHSLSRFSAMFTAGKTLRSSELRPGGYLRGSHSLGRNRFQMQLLELVRVMRILAT